MPDLPLLLLLADTDRAGLVGQLERLRALAPSDLVPSVERMARAPAGRERLSIVVSRDRLAASLQFAVERLPSVDRPRFVSRPHGLTFTRDATPGRIAFLFPGQGSEYVGMLSTLRDRFAHVNGWLADLDRAADEVGAEPLSPMIDPAPARASRQGLADMEGGAQLGTVADLALHEIVTALGIAADAHVGHSNGEHPAVIASGRVAWDRADLCRWFVKVARTGAQGGVARRERLVAVSAFGEARLREVLARERGVFHAMDNCPNQQVIGGDADAADAAARAIVKAGGMAVPLPFRRAYHTPLFADWAARFGACYEDLPLVDAGRVPVYSCVRVAPLPEDPDACRRAMAAQWTALVQFRTMIDRLHEHGFRTFVEIGPDAKLTAFVEDTLRGRPHLAVGASSVQRGELVQLFHLAGDLFAAGCTVNPAALDPRAAETPIVVSPERAPSAAAALIASMHEGLMADARASLERGQAAWRAVRGADAAPPRRTYPLLGTVVSAGPASLVARRTLTRAGDPFVDDHAFGRRPLADGAFPLPVVAFTASLELVAEAAHRLTGGPVREIRDAQASRWLALDAGRLTLDTDARRDGDAVMVRIREGDAGVRAAAFEGLASADRAPAVTIDRDREAAPPRAWSAASFYARYAFHGPGFRGLSAVTAVGPSGIEAEIVVTSNRGLPVSSLVVDPAMLDCAGQLVAFWLLEHGGLEPTFGIFPFAVGRVAVHREPLAPGTRLRCRGTIARRDAVTDARFLFETLDGSPVVSVEGLLQRLISLPRWLAALVFGGAALDDVVPLVEPATDRELLHGSWGIWARAVAHLCLSPHELERWVRMPAGDASRVDVLLARLAGAPSIRPPAGPLA